MRHGPKCESLFLRRTHVTELVDENDDASPVLRGFFGKGRLVGGFAAFTARPPGVDQFLSIEPIRPNQTEGQYCAYCERALSKLSKYSYVIPNLLTIDEGNFQSASFSSVESGQPNTRRSMDIQVDAWNPVIAQRLADEIRGNSLTAGSTIRIIFREDLVAYQKEILKQLRGAIQNNFSSKDSPVETRKADGVTSFFVGKSTRIGPKKLLFEVFSNNNSESNKNILVGAQNGKPKISAAYVRPLSPNKQLSLTQAAGGNEPWSLTVRFHGYFD